MTISFPRALPSQFPIVGMSFVPQPTQELSPLRAGRTIAVDLGPTLWKARFNSAPMEPAAAGEVSAWYDTLLSYETLLAYDVRREYPVAYASGWGDLQVSASPFNGTARLTDVDVNNVEIDLELLPVGFQFSPGDMLSFDYGTDARALHRVSAAVAANGSGMATVEVRPQVRTGWQFEAPALGRTVHLYRPTAKMIIMPGTYDEQADVNHHTVVSFEAIQTL